MVQATVMTPPNGIASARLSAPSAKRAQSASLRNGYGARSRGAGKKVDFDLEGAMQTLQNNKNGFQSNAAITADGQPGGSLNDEVGMCLNSTDKPEGIVGILEGFGLLNLDTEGTIQDPGDLLAEALEAALMAAEGEEATEITDLTQAKLFKGKESPQIEAAILEQMGSLENTNNVQDAQEQEGKSPLLEMMQAAVANSQRVQTKQQLHSGADQDTNKQAADDEGVAGIFTQGQPRAEGPQLNAEFQPVADMPKVAPADAEENLTKLIESIRAHSTDGQQEFQVQLKPEFLGKLSIKLVMDHDGIRAQIKAEDISVKGMIQNEIAMLEEALKTRGIEIKQIEVAYEAPAFDFNNQPHSQSGRFTPSKQNNRYAVAQMEQSSYTELFEAVDTLDLYAQNSSVEFHA